MGRLVVLIVGGGIGGATLANALAARAAVGALGRQLEVHLFERDERLSSRDQGLVIGVRQAALLAASAFVPDLGRHLSREGARHLCIVPSGDRAQPLVDVRGMFDVRLGGISYTGLIDRADFRNALLAAAAARTGAVTVHCGKRFMAFEETANGVTARFEDGTAFTGDILVGADGANSRVRAQRCPDLTPLELDVSDFYGIVPLDAADATDSSDLGGGGHSVLLSLAADSLVRKHGRDCSSLLCFRHVAPSGRRILLWSVSIKRHLAEALRTRLGDDLHALPVYAEFVDEYLGAEAAAFVRRTARESLKPLSPFTSVPSATVARNPLGVVASRVTLIGDAAHKTTTQAGLGASAAIEDALALASMIAECAVSTPRDDDCRSALARYQSARCKPAADVVATSVGNTERLHHPESVLVNGVMRAVGGAIWAVQTLMGRRVARSALSLREL